ncbi:methyltransferase domain-containing protein [Cytobacillus purgationiresistens]|nr:methyltransferase domain-containing protein [Cytobacillus purgationiresistens]
MQLTIHAKGDKVNVLSHLLAKNPENLYERNHKGHIIRLFYDRFTDNEVEATIYAVPDPIVLTRDRANTYDITHYINDREFAVSSIFLSFIRSALSTGLNGLPKDEYREWVDHEFDYTFSFGPVSTSLKEKELEGLFGPLGFELSFMYPYGKGSPHYLVLKGKTTLQRGLRQLYVLIPVIDNYKHYYIDEKEREKLERYGEGWLSTHPQKSFIIQKALRFKELFAKMEESNINPKPVPSKDKVSLNVQRYERIIQIINAAEDKESIVDFGSGEGKLSTKLGFVNGVKEILAVEPSERETLKASKRFNEAASHNQFNMPQTIWGSLFYYDERLKHKDVMILCEVIEHIDIDRLKKVMDTILGQYQPKLLIITTPNSEYNERYDLGQHYRHEDHRFELTRTEFTSWCHERSHGYPYLCSISGIGDEDEKFGSPTQICVFEREEL